ncbi:MAG: heat-inducible transcriptional repressor HrcA [Chlamydiota bacterium]|jgi:heat-inducible transcriptional repressor
MAEKSLKNISLKKPSKNERERFVLLGLVDLYIATNKPIGSNTLKESGFDYLSSATIRNYFAKLEKEGYLYQQHSSGGRVPTPKAYKFYAENSLKGPTVQAHEDQDLQDALKMNTKEIHSYLSFAVETLSEMTNSSVIISTPRFDQDFIKDVKLLAIDENRTLCALITDFGLVKTETFYTTDELEDLGAIEKYFLWRMSKSSEKPYFLNETDAKWAQRLYNEIVVRHLAGYVHFFKEDLFRTGLSKLLTYPEFSDAMNLSSALSIFENETLMQNLLHQTTRENCVKYWVAEDFQEKKTADGAYCSFITIPYYLNQSPAGSIGILSPMRINYKKIFGIAKLFSYYLSQNLTNNLYKFKIHFRQPSQSSMDQEKLHESQSILLEDKSRCF